MGLVLGVGKIFTWLYDLGKYRTARFKVGLFLIQKVWRWTACAHWGRGKFIFVRVIGVMWDSCFSIVGCRWWRGRSWWPYRSTNIFPKIKSDKKEHILLVYFWSYTGKICAYIFLWFQKILDLHSMTILNQDFYEEGLKLCRFPRSTTFFQIW